jgi:hypothetical protein
MSASGPGDWRFAQALARIEPTVAAIVAEQATSLWGRPARRHEVASGPDRPDRVVVWSIDDQTVVELRVAERGRATLVVGDFGLYSALDKALRTRHVEVRYAASDA